MERTIDWLFKLRASKTAALEKLQEEINHLDNAISIYQADGRRTRTHNGPGPVLELVNSFRPKERKRGYKRKDSWEGLEEDLKTIFNGDTKTPFTISVLYDRIKKMDANHYGSISRASVGQYLAGLRRAKWLDFDYIGRELVYTKSEKAA